MGGTEDKPGLLIQSNTVKGKTSLACRTFREFWPLARELEFKIRQIEIWTVDGGETRVEEDVRDLISKTQYMKTRGDEVYNETKRATIISNPPEMQGVTICCGDCAMDMLKPQPKSDPPSPKYKQQVCCSKRCPKKIKLSSRDRNGEGDGDVVVHAAHKVPSQEEEKFQRHHKYSIEEVKIKREYDSRSRRSFDARQKHGADGFIHPSLAAEENERNAKKAAQAAKQNEKQSNNQTKKPSNKTKASKKRRSSGYRELSQKSFSSNGSSYIQTTCNTQTQVGESRLIKPTGRTNSHSNKCSCVVKTTCACPPKESGLPSGNNKTTTMVASSQARYSETSNKSMKINGKRPTPKAQTRQNATDDKDQMKNAKSAPTADLLTSSSSSVLIKENLTPPEKDTLGNKRKSRTPYMEKSEASSKQHMGEPSRPGNEKENDTLYSYPIQNPVKEIANTQDNLSQDLMLPELDCHCSSESDSAVEEVAKKYNPATCSCQIKLSKYLAKTKQTIIADISLTDISSSVCSCILDDKKINMASPATPSRKETQNLYKSSRKGDGSAHSNQMTKNDDMTNLCTISPFCISSKKETQIHLQSKRVSGKSADLSVAPNKPPIPPISQHGCQCKLRSVYSRKKMTATDTQNLTNSRRYSDSSSASELVSTSAIKDNQSAMEKETPKRNRSVIIGITASAIAQDSKLEAQETGNSGSLLGAVSTSQSSLIKRAPKRTCGASCKCSLSPSYFPVFPEDFIKDDDEGCDCTSYNDLRFPVIVDTPPLVSSEPSIKSHASEPVMVEEPLVEEPKLKKCGCDDSDNTIIILNVSKCDTAATVEKLIHDLEEKAGDPKIKSLLFKCRDLTDTKSSTKNEADQETWKQNSEKVLRGKNPPA